MLQRSLRALVALFIVSAVFAPATVFAHDSITAGDYTIVYGWLNEPPVVGQPNAIELSISSGSTHSHHSGRVQLISPADGAEISGDQVEVTVAFSGLDHESDKMHWHLYVDDELVTMLPVATTSYAVTGLANGEHRLKAVLSDADHNELGTPAEADIAVSGSVATGAIETGEAAHDDVAAAHGHASEMPAEVDVSGLVLEIAYGGQTKQLTLRPVGDHAPGEYMARITPTRAGQYTLRLSGMLGDTEVNAEVQPEEVGVTDVYVFPEAAPSLDDLIEQLRATEARATTAQTVAIAGVVLGLVGVGTAAVGLLRRR